MGSLANAFPFIREFFLKILGYFGIDSGSYNSSIIDVPTGIVNLIIILLMLGAVVAFILGAVIFATRHQTANQNELENRTKRAKMSLISGTILLSLPLITMIAIAITTSTLPS